MMLRKEALGLDNADLGEVQGLEQGLMKNLKLNLSLKKYKNQLLCQQNKTILSFFVVHVIFAPVRPKQFIY